MYYYYNTRTTNEKSPIILYFTADTIKNVELQIRDKKKEYPKMFKNNDLINKIFFDPQTVGGIAFIIPQKNYLKIE